MIRLPYDIHTALDLIGAFVFARSGAVAARQKVLEYMQYFSIAFKAAYSGCTIRDLCINRQTLKPQHD